VTLCDTIDTIDTIDTMTLWIDEKT